MENEKAYDVIVIGGGAMGLSTAYHLSKRNAKTLVLEQFTFLTNWAAPRAYRVNFAPPIRMNTWSSW